MSNTRLYLWTLDSCFLVCSFILMLGERIVLPRSHKFLPPMVLKLVTWNVNGIRTLPSDLSSTLKSLDADIVCFQETKITGDQLDLKLAVIDDFDAFYSFCRSRGGYSGVAVFCRRSVTPVAASDGLSSLNREAGDSVGLLRPPEELDSARIQELDSEGRAVILQFKTRCCGSSEHRLSVIAVYCPRLDPENLTRAAFKADFNRLLQERAEQLAEEGHVVIAGDLNVSHRREDRCNGEDDDSVVTPTRLWFDNLLTTSQRDPELENEIDETGTARGGIGGLFADNFRVKHPDRKEAFTCWNTMTGARETNYGTRIDFLLSDTALTEHCLVDCDIHPDVMGSDHCPVSATFSLQVIPGRCPSLAAKFLPQFQGQRRISDFFSSRPAPTSRKRSVGQSRDVVAPKRASLAAETAVKAPGRNESAAAWGKLLGGAGKAPKCKGHGEPCVLRTVKKESANKGRQFWVCAKPDGPPSNPKSRCEHFEWVERNKS